MGYAKKSSYPSSKVGRWGGPHGTFGFTPPVHLYIHCHLNGFLIRSLYGLDDLSETQPAVSKHRRQPNNDTTLQMS